MSQLNTPEKYEHIAVINVDIQNDFCPGGALGVTDGDSVVDPMNRMNEFARKRDGTVIFTRDWHPRVTSHFIDQGGPWPPHCIAYTAGAAFHNDLIVDTARGDLVASKGTKPDVDDYSGMMAVMDTYRQFDRGGYNDVRLREFIGALQSRYQRLAVVVGGLATDYCVKATVLDVLGLRSTDQLKAMGVYILEDAIRAVDVQAGDGARAIEEMLEAGAQLTTTEDILSGSVLEVK